MSDLSLPEGVVTFVFTDIEGSTRLLQETPGTFAEVLDVHRAVLRRAFAEFDGREVNTEGDGCFVAFASASAAVLAAARAQTALAADPLLARHGVKVRIGMHTGEAERTGHDYVGLAVHHAARVANAGHGGQVLVSETTRLMAEEPEGLGFADLGEHVLKDLARPVRIFQLSGQGLERDFPPLRSLNSAMTALPVSRTSFVGRDNDLNQLLEDLVEPGLITLTGPGGTGKTRLAIEAAREVRGSLEGTWFVDLLTAADADQVLTATSAALGVLDVGQPDGPLDRLAERVGNRPCLIVLDNCEHVVEPVAELADGLLARCPGLRLLATSRDLLGLAHERARRVPPLEPGSAVELFVDRAARSVSGFEPTSEERKTIARVCHRLDGIPLAIELAAPRLRHISLEEFEARLGDVFRLLVGSRARGIQRHQTLQAVVDWSYNLLTAEEQVVLRRLSALSGGFTMEAAEAVAGGEPVTSAVEDIVFRLVDHSLVEHDGRGRYRQLETLRAYGQAKLTDGGESEAIRDRQVLYFLSWAETVAPGLKDDRFFKTLDELEAEADNLHVALEWAAEQRDRASVLRLAAATVQFGTLTSRDSLVKLADRAFTEAAVGGPPDLVAAAHVEFGLAAATAGWSRYATHASAAMELLGPEGPEPDGRDELRVWALAAMALNNMAKAEVQLADTRAQAERAMALADRCGLPTASMAAQSALAWDVMRSGDLDTARQMFDGVVGAGQDLKESLWFTVAAFWSGICCMRAADWTSAVEHYEDALVRFRRVSYKLYTQWVLDHLSVAALQLGDFAAARAYAEEGVALSMASGLGANSNLPYLYERLGYLEGLRGEHAQSARYYEQALEGVSLRQNAHDHAALRANLASALVECGELDEARVHLQAASEVTETLEPVATPIGEVTPPPVSNIANAVARLALAVGLADEAAELAGAVSKLHPAETATPATRERVAGFHAAIKSAVGATRFEAGMEAGAGLENPLRRAREVLELAATREPLAPARA